MRNYEFMRSVMTIMGYSPEEIEHAISRIDENPNEYQLLLSKLEDEIYENSRNKKESLY